SSGIVQLKQPRPFSKIEMARRNQAGHDQWGAGSSGMSVPSFDQRLQGQWDGELPPHLHRANN
ncbi:hypothetical protein QOU69_26475, partial [Burkholderia pseudomallei]